MLKWPILVMISQHSDGELIAQTVKYLGLQPVRGSSTRGGIEKFAAAMSEMGIPVVPLQLIDPYCYHLDTCLCPLNKDAALIFPGAYSADALAALHQFWNRIHLLTAEEAHRFMGNGIVVNGKYVTPYVSPQLKVLLQKEGLTPVIVDTSEFEKAGGSCFCMKTFLP